MAKNFRGGPGPRTPGGEAALALPPLSQQFRSVLPDLKCLSLSQHFRSILALRSGGSFAVTFAAADELSQQNGQNTPTFALLTPRANRNTEN